MRSELGAAEPPHSTPSTTASVVFPAAMPSASADGANNVEASPVSGRSAPSTDSQDVEILDPNEVSGNLEAEIGSLDHKTGDPSGCKRADEEPSQEGDQNTNAEYPRSSESVLGDKQDRIYVDQPFVSADTSHSAQAGTHDSTTPIEAAESQPIGSEQTENSPDEAASSSAQKDSGLSLASGRSRTLPTSDFLAARPALDDDSDDLEDSLSPSGTLSFRDLAKSRGSPSSTSSPPPPRLPLSTRSSHSGSLNSFKAYHETSSSSGIVREELSEADLSRHSSPTAMGPRATDAVFASHASSPGARASHSAAMKVSPLDNLDRLFVGQSPVLPPSSALNNRLPMRLGLLSFNDQDYDVTEINHSTVNGDRSAARFSSTLNNGVRRQEDRARRLETENMELRLKLQQYREMNASEQEITRVKGQVERAERRIDELELALERKNRTILELSEERDMLAARVRPEHEIEDLQITISELQTAITELESQSIEADKVERAMAGAIAGLRETLPDLIASDARPEDLVSALEHLHAENNQLMGTQASYDQLLHLLRESGHRGDDPMSVIKQLQQEIGELRDATEALSHQHKLRNREIEHLKDSHRQQVDSLLSSEDHLHQQIAKEQARRASLEGRIEELEEVVENQHRIVSETRADNYGIVRRFFSELIDVMGAEFQAKVEEELQTVIETAQSQRVSKLPLLTDLMLRFAREVAEEAVRSYTAPAVDMKVRAMEQEVQSLEHMLVMKLEKNGADAILLAQNRDLRRALKLEQEKRKTDWNEYAKTIAATR